MNEYIMVFPTEVKPGSIADVHERIVRCNDCREYIAFDKASRLGGFGFCELLEDKRHGTSLTHENGFCAWGERKVGK